jgi:hypothetical protein
MRTIPIGANRIQEGLYLYEYSKKIGKKSCTFRELYSAPGYHFYNTEQPENYDEAGELLPPEDRVYLQYAMLAQNLNTVDLINHVFISLPIDGDILDV